VTTFRTTRGAVVNVAAPEIYVAPSVTPNDVVNPTELREVLAEKLREELEHNTFTREKFVYYGLDAFFEAAVIKTDGTRTDRVKISDVWKLDDPVTLDGHVEVPSGYYLVHINAKKAYMYPLVSVDTVLPSSGHEVYFGFESGINTHTGLFAFRYFPPSPGSEDLLAYILTSNMDKQVSILNLAPANRNTARNRYMIQVTRNLVTWYINGVPVCFGVMTETGVEISNISGPPYAIIVFKAPVARTLMPMIEVNLSTALRPTVFNLSPADRFSFIEGDPCPPKAFNLYQASSSSLMAGASIGSGSLSSHPLPLLGWSGKTFYFQASQGGTLTIEVLDLNGVWRTYDSVPIAAGTLKPYPMVGDALLGRVTFTPSTYPATVNVAELYVR